MSILAKCGVMWGIVVFLMQITSAESEKNTCFVEYPTSMLTVRGA